MDKKTRITSPKYQRIAADIASKIVNGHYQIGDRIYARSSIASQYGVSSETEPDKVARELLIETGLIK